MTVLIITGLVCFMAGFNRGHKFATVSTMWVAIKKWFKQ
jgi:hypothetical protein